MTTTIVVDASFVTALIADCDEIMAAWAIELVGSSDFVAPHLMPMEVTSALRRAERQGLLTPSATAFAHRDLVDLGVDLYPFGPFASRVWELRHVVSPYDAWYVALAEHLEIPLVTLDERLGRGAGAWCEFLVPPSA